MRKPVFPFVTLTVAAIAACGGSDAATEAATDAATEAAADAGSKPMSTPEAGRPDHPTVPAPDSGDGAPVTKTASPVLPKPTGSCPAFANGTVTFSPAGIPPRNALVLMSDAAKTKHGPLLFYWYATGSGTFEASYSLGKTLAAIEAAGGIVVVPEADPTAGAFEWFIVNGSSKPDDFLVADEIVACAAENTAIDTTHIHAMGMSAGALQTTAMSFERSNYVASVATYSGGMPPGYTPTIEDPDNKFAALIFDGGKTDDVFGVDFEAASELYQKTLVGTGHFAPICDHGMGHSIPLGAAPSVWLFFQANGFGVSPSPYAKGLPASFPSYCQL